MKAKVRETFFFLASRPPLNHRCFQGMKGEDSSSSITPVPPERKETVTRAQKEETVQQSREISNAEPQEALTYGKDKKLERLAQEVGQAKGK